MKQKNIYVSSQNFGYGPTSNLFAILKSLKTKTDSFKIYAVQNESLELFALKEPTIIDSLSEEIDVQKSDLVLSSFDSFLILEAWLSNIPTVFYCNLFWYWDIYNQKEKLISLKNQLTKLKENKDHLKAKKLFTQLFNENPHIGIFMGFLLANYSFTRNFASIEKFIEIFKNEINLSVFDIYIPYELKSIKENKTNILIQLSGGRNSIVTNEENVIYLEYSLFLAKYLASTYQKYTITICANPKILAMIDLSQIDLARNIKVISSLSQQKNLEMMEKSLAINPDRFLINETFPKRQRLPGEEDAHAIYQLIKTKLLNSFKYQKIFFRKASKFIQKVQQPEKRKQYIDMSLSSLKGTSSNDPFTTKEAVSDFIIERYG